MPHYFIHRPAHIVIINLNKTTPKNSLQSENLLIDL
jgi:hypothetical protein